MGTKLESRLPIVLQILETQEQTYVLTSISYKIVKINSININSIKNSKLYLDLYFCNLIMA